MIKIAVRDVKQAGLDINQTIPKEGIGLSDEEIDLRSPINVKAHLERAGNIIIARTHVEADFGYLCARCLEQLHEVQAQDYDFNFKVSPGDEYIDLGEEIRQEFILANSAKVLCKEDCKGLCPKCGVNLNVEQCKCQK